MISLLKAAPLLASRSFRISLCATSLGIISIAVAANAGPRFGLLLLIGGGMGATLEGLGFGFAGPWRRLILARNPSGFLAQILSMALVALIAFPLLGTSSRANGGACPGWVCDGSRSLCIWDMHAASSGMWFWHAC